MIYQIQKKLIQTFPEFDEQKSLIEYYTSFQFPDKQKKMISWWEAVLTEAVKISKKLYLSPSQLDNIFTVHRLKPVPLNNILKHLERQNKIAWQGKPEEKGWFSNMLGKMWNGSKNQKPTLSNSERIVMVKYKQEKMYELTFIIKQELQNENIIDYEHLRNTVKEKILLDPEAIDELMEELISNEKAKITEIEGRKVFLYSMNGNNYENKKWVEVEKSKFTLKKKIEYFQYQIHQKDSQRESQRQKAKFQLEKKNTINAKHILQTVQQIEKITAELRTRKHLLSQSLHSLQMNEINKITYEQLKKSHEIIQETEIDPALLEQISQRDQEIKMNQRQINQKYGDMIDEEEINQQVDKLLEELQVQIKGQTTKETKKNENSHEEQKGSQNQKLVSPIMMFQK